MVFSSQIPEGAAMRYCVVCCVLAALSLLLGLLSGEAPSW